MATKSANVTARVQPEIKRQAEAVLDKDWTSCFRLDRHLIQTNHYDRRRSVFLNRSWSACKR